MNMNKVLDVGGDDNDQDIFHNTIGIRICDQVDGVVCYILLGIVCSYTAFIWIRERFYIKKSHCLRVFSLLFKYVIDN